MRRKLFAWAAVLTVGALVPLAWGQNNAYWTAAGDTTSWSDANNWIDGSAPLTVPPALGDFVMLWDNAPDNGSAQIITLPAGGGTCGCIQMNPTVYDYILDGGPLTLGQQGGGSLRINSGMTKSVTFNCNIVQDASVGTVEVVSDHSAAEPAPVITFNGSITGMLETGLSGNGALVLNAANPGLTLIHNWAPTEIVAGNPGALGGGYWGDIGATLGLKSDVSVPVFGTTPYRPSGPIYVRNRGTDGPHTLTTVATSFNSGADTVIIQPNPDGGTDDLTIRITDATAYYHGLNWQTIAGTTISLGSDKAGFVQLQVAGGQISGAGRLVIDSAAANIYISRPQSYTGGTFVNRGTAYFDAANTLPPGGDVYVASAGLLIMGYGGHAVSETIGNLTGGDAGSAATINTLGATLTVNGTLAPGNGAAGSLGAINVIDNAGTLALVGGATFDVQNPDTVQDQVTVENSLVLGGTLTVRAMPWVMPGTYTLMTAAAISGEFSNVVYDLPDTWEGSVAVDGTTVKVTLTGEPLPTPTPTPAPLPGDANRDGAVTFEDFSALQNHYGQSGMGWDQGDFDGNGRVDFADFSLLQNHYGMRSGTAAPAGATATAGLPCSALGLALTLLFGWSLLFLRNQDR